jgi:hypothetical protein
VVLSSMKSESLARGVVITMMPVRNLDDGPHLKGCVCLQSAFGSQNGCALATIVFHDDRRGYLYRVSTDFPLINQKTIFS